MWLKNYSQKKAQTGKVEKKNFSNIQYSESAKYNPKQREIEEKM